MTAPKNIPSEEAGYNGCSANQHCFYEGSRKEYMCSQERICVRDMEVRVGHELTNKPQGEELPTRPSARKQKSAVAEKPCVLDPNTRCPDSCCSEDDSSAVA